MKKLILSLLAALSLCAHAYTQQVASESVASCTEVGNRLAVDALYQQNGVSLQELYRFRRIYWTFSQYANVFRVRADLSYNYQVKTRPDQMALHRRLAEICEGLILDDSMLLQFSRTAPK